MLDPAPPKIMLAAANSAFMRLFCGVESAHVIAHLSNLVNALRR